MSRINALPALILAATLVCGCSTEWHRADEAADPEKAFPTTPANRHETADWTLNNEWACAPSEVSGFATDPVVHPAALSLEAVASKLDEGLPFHIDSNTGRLATVTFRNEEGLIVKRLKFARSKSVGRHIERGRTC